MGARFLWCEHEGRKVIVDTTGAASKAKGIPLALPDLSHWDFFETEIYNGVTQVRAEDGRGNRLQLCVAGPSDHLLAWLHDLLVAFEGSGVRSDETIYR